MIVLDIAEWIANLLILGLAAMVWGVAVFLMLMLLSLIKKWIDNFVRRFK